MKDEQPDPLQDLWQAQPTNQFPVSLEDIRRNAATLRRQVFWRNGREYAAVIILAVVFDFLFLTHDEALSRIGAALVIAGALYVAVQLHRRGSSRPSPVEMGLQACRDFHLHELECQCALLRSVWSWYLGPLVPGMTLYLLGRTALHPGVPAAHRILGFVSFGIAALAVAVVFRFVYRLNQRAADRLQQQVDALKRVEAESGN